MRRLATLTVLASLSWSQGTKWTTPRTATTHYGEGRNAVSKSVGSFCRTHHSRRDRRRRLPLDRLGIYSACGEVLARHWNVSAHDASVRTDDKMALLQRAAIEMRDPADGRAAMLISEERLRSVFADALAARDVPAAKRVARAIVSDLGDQHSLIRRVGSKRYSFVHQTFLDFFAAREFSERLRKAKEEADRLRRQQKSGNAEGEFLRSALMILDQL